jgi:hypothetical protein
MRLDLLSLVSYIHRRVDATADAPRSTALNSSNGSLQLEFLSRVHDSRQSHSMSVHGSWRLAFQENARSPSSDFKSNRTLKGCDAPRFLAAIAADLLRVRRRDANRNRLLFTLAISTHNDAKSILTASLARVAFAMLLLDSRPLTIQSKSIAPKKPVHRPCRVAHFFLQYTPAARSRASRSERSWLM